MERFCIFCALVILLAPFEITAQVTPRSQTNPAGDTSSAQKQQREAVENSRWNTEVAKRADGTNFGDSNDVDELIRRKLRAKESLEPEKKFKKMFTGFLKQKNAGLIKLSGPKDCRIIEVEVYKPDDPCAASYIPGGGKAFSFRHKEYSGFAESDIQRNEGDLIAQGSFVFGMLTSLGDVSLESISIETPAVTSALQFSFSGNLEEIKHQEKELVEGKLINGVLFSNQLPIRKAETYLLRSIACPAILATGLGEKERKVLRGDKKRFDIVVAFHIVEEHPDGSLTLVWKEIHRQDSPTIEVTQEN